MTQLTELKIKDYSVHLENMDKICLCLLIDQSFVIIRDREVIHHGT